MENWQTQNKSVGCIPRLPSVDMQVVKAYDERMTYDNNGVILTGQTRLRFGSVRFTLVACAVKIMFGSLWFNMASVDVINFENKYDYPDNYEL